MPLVIMLGRESDIAMNAWLPKINYLGGEFSATPCNKIVNYYECIFLNILKWVGKPKRKLPFGQLG